MFHSINQAITLHFLISNAIRNNCLYQRSVTVQESNLSGLSHVFTGNSLKSQIVSTSLPLVQLNMSPKPMSDPEVDCCVLLTSRMVAEWHSFTRAMLPSYKLLQASYSPHLQQRNSFLSMNFTQRPACVLCILQAMSILAPPRHVITH